jgi:uncharacterized protein (TIGR00730 family)
MTTTPRRAPLPWQSAKPALDDPDAPARIAAILASPSYIPGGEDPDFIRRDDLRGERLLMDYLKPELLLQAAGIEHAIVVFGSTRIEEPGAAQRRAEAASAAAAAEPGNAELRARAASTARLAGYSRYYEMAREFGRLVSCCNPDPRHARTVIMTGGGPGIMEAANRGAFDAGAQTVGLNIDLPHEQFPNPYVTPELCFRFHYFSMRKLHFLQRARALVVFPGGYGSLDELFEALTLLQARKTRAVPVVLVGAEYWRRVIDLQFLVTEGIIDPEDIELFWYAEDAASIWEGIVAWYRNAGENPFGG